MGAWVGFRASETKKAYLLWGINIRISLKNNNTKLKNFININNFLMI